MKTTMKKKYLLFAATALTLAACSNDENLNDGPVPIRLSSGIEVQEVTRAATDIQGNAFGAGESVDVFIREDVPTGQTATTKYEFPLTYTTGTGGAMNPPAGKQPYFPTSGNGVNIYAYYPVDVVRYIEDTETVEFTVKSDQSTDADYKASDLMFAEAANVSRTANAVPLTFTHRLSKVTIILEAGAGLEEADLVGAKVELLDVKPEVTITTITCSISAAEGDPTNITVFTSAEGALSGSAIVVPQELPARFVRVTLDDGGVLVGTLSGNVRPNLESGNAYTYTITANLTGLDITASITPWNERNYEGSAEMQ